MSRITNRLIQQLPNIRCGMCFSNCNQSKCIMKTRHKFQPNLLRYIAIVILLYFLTQLLNDSAKLIVIFLTLTSSLNKFLAQVSAEMLFNQLKLHYRHLWYILNNYCNQDSYKLFQNPIFNFKPQNHLFFRL
jgi:hypothetical protein